MSGILFGRYSAYRRSLGFLYVSYRPGSISLASSIQHQRREKHQDTNADDGKGDGRGGATVDEKAKVRATRLRQVKPIEVRQNISKKNNPNVEDPTVTSGTETSGLTTSFIECDTTSPSKVNTIPEIPMERKHESPFEFLPELPLPGQTNPVEVQPKDPLKVTCQAADSSNEMESSEARKDQTLELGQSYYIIQAELSNEENDPHTMKLISEYTNFPNPALNFDFRLSSFEMLQKQIEADTKFRAELKALKLKSDDKPDAEPAPNTDVRNANFEVLKRQIEAENKFRSGEYTLSTPSTIKPDQETIDVEATTVFAQAEEQSERSEHFVGSITENEEKHESIIPSPSKVSKKFEIKTQPMCEAVCELQNAVSKIAEKAAKTSNKKENVEVNETETEISENESSAATSRVVSDIQKLYSKIQNEYSSENISTTSNEESVIKSDIQKLYSKLWKESSSENSSGSAIVGSGIKSDIKKLYSELLNESSSEDSKAESDINSELDKLYSKMQTPEPTDSITEVTKASKINESASPNALKKLYAMIENPESSQNKTRSKIENDSKPIVANQFKTNPSKPIKTPATESLSQSTNTSMASSTGTNELNDIATADIVAMFDQNEDYKFNMNTEEPSEIKSFLEKPEDNTTSQDNLNSGDTTKHFNLETVSTNFVKMRNVARNKKEDSEEAESKSTKDLLKAIPETSQSEIKSSLEKPEDNTTSQDNPNSEDTTEHFNLETVSTNFVKMRNEARNKNKKKKPQKRQKKIPPIHFIYQRKLCIQKEIKAKKNRKAAKEGKSKKSTPQLDDGELGVKLVTQNPEDSAPIKAEKSGLVQYLFDKIFSVGKKTGRRTMATFSGSHFKDTGKDKTESKTKNLKQEPFMDEVYISPALDEQGLGAKNILKARETAEQNNDSQRKNSSLKEKDDRDPSLEANGQISTDTTKCVRENGEHSPIICGSLRDKQKIREMAKSHGDGGKASFTSTWQRLTRMVWFYIFPDAATAAAPTTKSK
ncbi:uncharacterized protein [Drosophila tropicalis]|uniref:uncharacterized protein n=1 Tax=Drosophila tropicalis TaxID=46794 RepID=UPI0035AB7919